MGIARKAMDREGCAMNVCRFGDRPQGSGARDQGTPTTSGGPARGHPSPRSPLDGVDWLASPQQTENACRLYLESLRWPEGVSCPRCEGRSITDIPARRRFYCRRCRHFFSLTSGTAFHNSHLPLWKWFLAIELVLSTDGGIPANELMTVLGGSYKTAWFVEHRIRAALGDVRPGRHVQRGKRAGVTVRTYAAAVTGRYHQLGLKYLPAYEAEKNWRAQHRRNPNAFRDTVLTLLRAEPLAFDELTAGEPLVALASS
jgi:transposase-like protein